MGRLSTHVLDTANGIPAQGVALALYRLSETGAPLLLKNSITNADGRTDAPLLEGADCVVGCYELVFHIGPYFLKHGHSPAGHQFLDAVPVRFHITDAQARYHVPLVCSPWSYSTYRGS